MIEPTSGLSEAEIQRMVREAEQHAAEDARRREEAELRNRPTASPTPREKLLASPATSCRARSSWRSRTGRRRSGGRSKAAISQTRGGDEALERRPGRASEAPQPVGGRGGGGGGGAPGGRQRLWTTATTAPSMPSSARSDGATPDRSVGSIAPGSLAVEFQDYYAVLGVPKTATEKEIRPPTASSPGSTIRTSIPATARPRNASSRSTRRTRSSPTPRSARSTTSSDRAGASTSSGSEPGGRRRRGGQPFDWGGSRARARAGRPLRVPHGQRGGPARPVRRRGPFSDFFETFFGRSAARGAGRAAARGRRRRDRGPARDLEHPVEITSPMPTGARPSAVARTADGQTRRLEVKIPPGVRRLARPRRRPGRPGHGRRPAGDLYLVITVRPDPRFERRGDDLHTEVRAPLATLLLGGEARVPTPDGRTLALTIPAGTQDGRVFRLRGQGMPRLGTAELAATSTPRSMRGCRSGCRPASAS